MRKSEFRALVTECIIDAIKNNSEIRAILSEVVQSEAKTIVESASPPLPKEPKDAELYDKLMFIAQGKVPAMKYRGKSIQAPNYGNGYKSGKAIKEWTDKTYSKLGGSWITQNSVPNNGENLRALQSLFGVMVEDSNPGKQIMSLASEQNDEALKQELSKLGVGTTRVSLDENDNTRVDIMDLLLDTAKTTLIEQQAHSSIGGIADTSAMKVATSMPDELFGNAAISSEEKSAPGSWASMAFGD